MTSIPFKVRVFEALVTYYNKTYSYIRTVKIADKLNAGYKRTIRALKALEQQGLAQRKGQRGGWRPALMAGSIYRTILNSYRRTYDYVSTKYIAHVYDNDDGWMRQYLRRLEAGGLIERGSDRSGWKPVRATHTPAVQTILDVLEELYWKSRTFISTVHIAERMNLNPRYARELLNHWEQQGAVRRAGQRGGWRPQFGVS